MSSFYNSFVDTFKIDSCLTFYLKSQQYFMLLLFGTSNEKPLWFLFSIVLLNFSSQNPQVVIFLEMKKL